MMASFSTPPPVPAIALLEPLPPAAVAALALELLAFAAVFMKSNAFLGFPVAAGLGLPGEITFFGEAGAIPIRIETRSLVKTKKRRVEFRSS